MNTVPERICAMFVIDGEPRFMPIIRAKLAWEWVEALRQKSAPGETEWLIQQIVREYVEFVEEETP